MAINPLTLSPSVEATEAIRKLARHHAERLDKAIVSIHSGIAMLDAARLDESTVRTLLNESTRAISARWLAAMSANPGPVPPDAPWQLLDLVRITWRAEGRNEADVRAAFQYGQNAAWLIWQRSAADQIADPHVLTEVLEISASSMFEHVEKLSENVIRQMKLEELGLADSVSSRRLAIVRSVLQSDLTNEEASGRLGYELKRQHTCLLIWSASKDEAASARVATEIAAQMSDHGCFQVSCPGGVQWLWLSGDSLVELAKVVSIAEADGAMVAVGESASGVRGFRRSHETATTVRSFVESSHMSPRLTRFEDVALVSLASYDRVEAMRFARSTLNALAEPGKSIEILRETLRVYLQEGEHAPRAADRLHTHRNTVNYRLAKAEELIGRPLAERRLEIAAALEIIYWFGA